MILNETDKRTVEAVGDIRTAKFGAEEEDFPMLFHIIRNTLYSDKPLAVIREYATNAYDANIEAGKATTPIRVTLPNTLAPELRIRDFGKGLSYEEMFKVFVKYCKSTKRDSNAVVGMLGIGAKSGFCYGESFSVTSFQNGTKRFYSCYMDETKCGEIAEMGFESTSEPDGLEIVVPVKHFDCEEFKEKAIMLFRYWDVKPEVHGVLNWDTLVCRPEPDFSGSGWAIYRNESPVAIMGNVPYRLDETAIGDISSEESYILKAGIELRFNIGDLDFASNREQLQYTDKTKKAIHDKLTSILEEISNQVNSKIQGAKTLWEVRTLYKDLFLSGVFSSSLRHLLSVKSVSWNGFDVNSSYFSIPEGFYENNILIYDDVHIKKYARSYRRRSSSIEENNCDHFDAEDGALIFFNDCKKRVKSRIRHFLLEDYNKSCVRHNLYLINYTSEKAKETLIKEMGLEGAPIQLLSSLPIPPAAARQGSAFNKFKLFEFDVNCTSRDKNDYWTPIEVDLEEEDGVYVEINCYNVLWCGCYQHPRYLAKIFRTFKELKVTIPRIYAFKRSVLTKTNLHSGWIKLETFVQETAKEKIDSLNIGQDIVDAKEFEELESDLIKSETRWGKLDKASPFLTFVQACHRLKAAKIRVSRYDETMRLLRELNVNVENQPCNVFKPTYKINEMYEAIRNRYPMLPLVEPHFRYTWGKDLKKDAETLIEYIRSVDKPKSAQPERVRFMVKI